MKNHHADCRCGFSMIEAAAMVLVLSMIGMTVGPSLGQMRSRAMGAASMANLQEIGVGAAIYAGANNGRLFSYSWRADETYVMPNGKSVRPLSDQTAAMRQSQEVLQRRTGRLSGETRIRYMTARIPHRRFNHLVLMDFLNEPMESARYIDPADDKQLYWHANPLEYLDDGNTLPYGRGVIPEFHDASLGWTDGKVVERWTFASSYQCVPSSWQSDFRNRRYEPLEATPHLYDASASGGILLSGGRALAEVRYPSNKVWIHEEFDREQSPMPFFAYDHARAAKLMFDGSVNEWASGDANRSVGGRFYRDPWKQFYVPLDRFPQPMGGLGDETLLNMRYRWTKGGLLNGVDYGPVEAPRGPRAR